MSLATNMLEKITTKNALIAIYNIPSHQQAEQCYHAEIHTYIDISNMHVNECKTFNYNKHRVTTTIKFQM